MHDFKRLDVWHRSIELAADCYRVTEDFPKHERYSLTSQLRRSAVSIPSNIAEGSRAETSRDWRNYLRIAYGSACELESQLTIAQRVGLGDSGTIERLAGEANGVSRMLFGLLRSIDSE